MFLHNLWLIVTSQAMFLNSQIVIIMNFVVVSSVGIKRVICISAGWSEPLLFVFTPYTFTHVVAHYATPTSNFQPIRLLDPVFDRNSHI